MSIEQDQIVVAALKAVIDPALRLLSDPALDSGNGELVHLARCRWTLEDAGKWADGWARHRATNLHSKKDGQ